ncbi:MAG: STAS domain-containing protein [SAR324 cluster bacterium]|nr:STAS domain-containing protein [SAR324 cluster bacterium]
MNLSHRMEGNICVVGIQGELTNLQPARLNNYVESLLKTITCSALLFDLKEMTKVDSMGLGSLIVFSKIAADKGLEYAICQPNSDMRFYLEASGMLTKINIYETQKGALKQMNHVYRARSSEKTK